MNGSDGENEAIVRVDTFVAYVVAFILDGIGLLCALMALTVFLLPAVQIIQGITAIIGGFFFTLWVVVCRKKGVAGIKQGISKTKGKLSGIPVRRESVEEEPEDFEDESDDSYDSAGESLKNKLTKTWVKRVLIPFIIENIPIVGKILTTWLISVYLETKND